VGTRVEGLQMSIDPAEAGRRLYSIGHSNHDLPTLLRLLRAASVTALADVRSSPYSQRYPQFNRPEVERALNEEGIAYVFLGDRLGGRPRPRELYDAEGRVNYERVRATASFRDGLEELTRYLEPCTVVMMCSEQDPLDCHRGLMIAPALTKRGIAPGHLRRDGSIESTAEMEQRLLAATGVGEGLLDGLFAATLDAEERRALLAEAYRVMSRRKAFRLRPGGPSGTGQNVAEGEKE
jgi:uncharacterized protein (DUF488 family)